MSELDVKYMVKIKKLFCENKPNIIYGFDEYINNYEWIIELWKKFLFNKTIILPEKYEKIIKDVFKFHLNKFDHVIIFQSFNLSNALLMCRIEKKYFNIIIPKIPFDRDTCAIIATFT